jgi:hypothetical protein
VSALHQLDDQVSILRDDLHTLSREELENILVHYAQCDRSIFYDLCLRTSSGDEAIDAAECELDHYQPYSNRHQAAEEQEGRIANNAHRVLFAVEYGTLDKGTKVRLCKQVIDKIDECLETCYDEGFGLECVKESANKLLDKLS